MAAATAPVDMTTVNSSLNDNSLNGEEGAKTYYLAEEVAVQDSDEEYNYEEIPVEEFDDLSESDGEETLEKVVRSINEKAFFGVPLESSLKPEEISAGVEKQPEVVDDFIRNFLSSKGLMKSLDAFQNEWYEFQQKQRLPVEDTLVVSNVYQQNQEMSSALDKLRSDVNSYKEIASKARATHDKLRKERDFHRMHHKRVVQEKNKLISDIKRLKKHYDHYEPTLKQLQHKYEVVMKEKMLIKLERDRLSSKAESLEAAKLSLEKAFKDGVQLKDVRRAAPQTEQKAMEIIKKTSKEPTLPAQDRVNPHASIDLPAYKAERAKLNHTIKGHGMAVSALTFHPKKPVLASVSDDKVWKMWAYPSGELIMSGEGHKDWISDCAFNPKGTHLATASGDGTVKLWDFSKSTATLTLADHTQGVWGCAFHDSGDFIASCSMDHTAKLWDLTTGKARQTFRGHADSVNAIGFQPYTNTLYTCSGDKTVSLWDARTGICFQTLYGHLNAINSVSFTLNGETLASCDADGIVKFWDIRTVSELASVQLGTQSLNKLSFDPSGKILAVAGNNGTLHFISTKDHTVSGAIKVSETALNAIAFEKGGESLVVAGSDGLIRSFQ